jgi:hypothetical protein
MSDTHGKYTIHTDINVAGFNVVDSTTTGGLRPHDDVIWLGYGIEGRWLTPEEVLTLAEALKTTAQSHIARHNTT